MEGKNGFRQSKGPSTKDRIRALETNLENSQQALNISQMMIKQLMQQIDMLRKDGNNSINMCNDLQYRTLAMLNLLNVDLDALDKEADRLKLVDYNNASDKEDKEKNYSIGDVVGEGSIVIVTSTTETEVDQGIFRSKIPVAQIPFEQMKTDIIGKKVGDKFEADLNGVKHNIEIVGIRELPAKLEVVEDAPVEEKACDGNCACEEKAECCGDCAVEEKVDEAE